MDRNGRQLLLTEKNLTMRKSNNLKITFFINS